MRAIYKILVLGGLLISSVAQATGVWSSCQTIVGVANYTGVGNGSIILALSPGISGCSPAGISYAVEFAVGENGITATNLNSYLASALAAYASGLRVQIDYDNSTSYCYGAIIANGGFSGTC